MGNKSRVRMWAEQMAVWHFDGLCWWSVADVAPKPRTRKGCGVWRDTIKFWGHLMLSQSQRVNEKGARGVLDSHLPSSSLSEGI